MKKILVIANLFYASPRIPYLSYSLAKMGFEVTIITPTLDGNSTRNMGLPLDFEKKVKIFPVPFRDVFYLLRRILKCAGGGVHTERPLGGFVSNVKKKFGATKKKSFVETLMNLYRFCVLAFPDDDRPWKNIVIKNATSLFQREKYDVILSSSPFPTAHWIASELKRKYDIPWIADFRDPWSQNHDYPYGKIRKWIDTKLEKRIMSNVDLMIAATPEFARKQSALHGKETLVLTNGFDAEFKPPLLVDTSSTQRKLNITYTGKIYQNKQDPEKIFRVLKKLINSGHIIQNEIVVNFYGPPASFLSDLIDKNGLNGIVCEGGVLAREDSLNKQRDSQILLLLNWEDLGEKGIYPTKFFEYLAAGRPILATGGYESDDVKEMISRTQSGTYAITDNEIEAALCHYWNEFKRKDKIPYYGDWNEIKKYSYENLAKQLAEIINKVVVPAHI